MSVIMCNRTLSLQVNQRSSPSRSCTFLLKRLKLHQIKYSQFTSNYHIRTYFRCSFQPYYSFYQGRPSHRVIPKFMNKKSNQARSGRILFLLKIAKIIESNVLTSCLVNSNETQCFAPIRIISRQARNRKNIRKLIQSENIQKYTFVPKMTFYTTHEKPHKS